METANSKKDITPSGNELVDALRRIAISRGEATSEGWSTVRRDGGMPGDGTAAQPTRVLVSL